MARINAGNKGLANLGNTCYMNSALQCLSHLLTFHPQNEKFHACCEELPSSSLMQQWYQFQRKMWNNDDNNVQNPITLLKCFQKQCIAKNYYFNNFDQNDVDEFLTIFLDLIHQSIKRKVTITFKTKVTDEGDKIVLKSNETWKKFYENDYSYIVENFYAQLLALTSCPKCKYYTSNHDPLQVLSLEIPESAECIKDCLKEYTKKIRLDEDNMWTCDQCHQRVRPEKQTRLWKVSDVLIILLKRFKNGMIRTKIDRFIEYPMVLDLKEFNMNYGKKRKNTYALQSFAVHDGSLGGGHYYAICKNYLDDHWYQYNDTHVNQLNETDILNYSPYLFFYKRQ